MNVLVPGWKRRWGTESNREERITKGGTSALGVLSGVLEWSVAPTGRYVLAVVRVRRKISTPPVKRITLGRVGKVNEQGHLAGKMLRGM